MDWRAIVSVLGVLVAAYSAVFYIRTILAGESKPHRITWGGWTIVGVLGLVSSIRGHAGIGLVVAGAFVVGVAAVFVLSCFRDYGKPGGGKLDYLVGVVAAVALLTQLPIDYSPNLGQSITLVADLVFFWPTLRDSWQHPEYEAVKPWMVGAIGESLGIVALGNYSYAASAYSFYILAGNLALIWILTYGQTLRKAEKKRRRTT